MNYFSLLELHGLELSTDEKVMRYKNVVCNALLLLNRHTCPINDAYDFCIEMKILFDPINRMAHADIHNKQVVSVPFLISYILNDENKEIQFSEYLSRLSILIKSMQDKPDERLSSFIYTVTDGLAQCALPYEFAEGIIIPKGSKLLDTEVILFALNSAQKYKRAYDNYLSAIRQYYEGNYIRNAADNLRASMEFLIKDLIENSNFRLENAKSELGNYLKLVGIPTYLRNMICETIADFCDYQNNYVKHDDLVKKEHLEYLIYQSGVIIRFLLTM